MGLYTASLWTTITSSNTIPAFDTSIYTLKSTIDDTSHDTPGSPYTYPINLTVGNNLYMVFTAPSGSNTFELVCVSSSFRATPGRENDWRVRVSLRNGSCAASGSVTNDLGGPIQVSIQAVDNNNNYYYEDIAIANAASFGEVTFEVGGFNSLESVQIYYIGNPNPSDFEIIECSTCGQQATTYFDTNNAVVQPASITSSIFPAQILNVSGGNYGVKVSSSVDGLFANCDVEIAWQPGLDTPIYYTGSLGSIYYSTAISASVQKNDCSPSEYGTTVTYTLPASSSFSTSSYIAAQTAAQATFNANSQSYANTYGTCYPTESFVNVNAKYINSTATLQYTINGGSPVSLGVIDSLSCSNWDTISGLLVGDMIRFSGAGDEAVSGSTISCPAFVNGCVWDYYVTSGTSDVYVTINGDFVC
jgi:hypothetical protein